MSQATARVLSPTRASRVAQEVSELVGTVVEPPQVHAMARVARTRDPDVLVFLEKFLTAVSVKAVRREALVAGLTEAMNAVTRARLDDPLHDVDEPLSLGEVSGAVARAEAEATRTRRAILRDCVTAEAAARLTRRSRQSLERFRREGRVLALRERNQWLYPRWQFAPDATGGIVDGLDAVLSELHLSAAGAAYWLVRRHDRLKAAPMRLLRSGRLERVLLAARDYGERV